MPTSSPRSSYELQGLIRPPLHSAYSSTRSGRTNSHILKAANDDKIDHLRRAKPLAIYIVLGGLFFTTVFSILLLLTGTRRWTFSGDVYRTITGNRASVSLIVQVLANALGAVHVASLCTLINYAGRVKLSNSPTKVHTLRFWHSLCTRTVDWAHLNRHSILLVAFLALTIVPSAIWAGALTPVVTTVQRPSTFHVPAYRNTTFIREWPSGINLQGPTLRGSRGLFTYNVGTLLQGGLLASAASATPVGNDTRQHGKLDYTQYTYVGRSYGVGSSVGLLPAYDYLSENTLFEVVQFQESGFLTDVTCIHNQTLDFDIYPDEDMLYMVSGYLPTSSNETGPEESVYVGHDTSAIVALGVGRDQTNPRRLVAIAAGSSYSNLDHVQCDLNFVPTLFNVTVDLTARNISVVPLANESANINASLGGLESSNITYILTRQFELIANDQTNLYVSLVGNSLNDSITDYMTAQQSTTGHTPGLNQSTLVGLQNAFTAMADDMLVAYASAQLMIAGESESVPSMVTQAALRVGQDVYIYASFAVNVVILLLVAVEAIRTKTWHRLARLDFLDVGAVVVAAASKDEVSSNHVLRPNNVGKRTIVLTRESALRFID